MIFHKRNESSIGYTKILNYSETQVILKEKLREFSLLGCRNGSGRLQSQPLLNPLYEILNQGTPPSADILPTFIERLCTFFNDKEPEVFIHPILRAIIVHFLIGYYHPFADGNGRTARALFYWYMMRSNYWLIQYLSISRVIKGTKKAYEKAYLFTECDGNDIGYFIQYNLEVLHKSFEELRKYLIRKNNEKKKSERLLRLGNISPRQSQILARFIDNPEEIITSMDIIDRFNVSPGTAKSDLKKLAQLGYLDEFALNGRTKGYTKSDSMDIMISDV